MKNVSIEMIKRSKEYSKRRVLEKKLGKMKASLSKRIEDLEVDLCYAMKEVDNG